LVVKWLHKKTLKTMRRALFTGGSYLYPLAALPAQVLWV